MLEQLRQSLEPRSLVDVVPAAVLQGLMQGFAYGNRSGMMLVYDEGRIVDGRAYKRLYPTDPNGPEGRRLSLDAYCPFCAKFREDEARNRACEGCDADRTEVEFDDRRPPARYTCHMGLTDLTAGVRLNNRVRGVLFSGQKVSKTPAALADIRRRTAQKAADIAPELDKLMLDVAISPDELDAFEAGFLQFARAVQATVDAFAHSRQQQAERAALLVVNEYLARREAEDVSRDEPGRPLFLPADPLFRELEEFTGGGPVWLLQRRGSRYACIAASPAGAHAQEANLPAWVLIETPADTLRRVPTDTPTGRELKRRLGVAGDGLTVVRSETRISQAEWSSVAVVIGRAVPPQHESFLVGCARALTYPTGASTLLRRLQKQQADFTLAASFTGHHIKTPLQIALWDVREAARQNGPTAADAAARSTLLGDAVDQIGQGLADALRLQAATAVPKRERFNVSDLVTALMDRMRPLGRPRNVQLRLTSHLAAPCYVFGVALQIRVALSNLLDNAIKYSYEKKVVEVHVSTPYGLAGGYRPSVVQITIEDVGVGFPPEQKDELFSIGVRLDQAAGRHTRPGAGIGLTQAKEYLEAAGGSLDIDSEALPTFTGDLSRVTVLIHLPIV